MSFDMKKLSLGCAHDNGADQPAHPRRVISISVIGQLFGKYHLQTCYKRNFHFSSYII